MLATAEFELPPFLVVTPQEQARRNAWNAAHPVQPSISFANHNGTISDEELERRRAEERAKAKAASYDRIAKLKSGKSFKAAASEGMVWRNGKFIRADYISQARFDRMYRELPTDSMRKILVERYAHRVPGGWKPPKEGKRK